MQEPTTPQSTLPEGSEPAGHKPYVPDEVVQPEFTLAAVVVGAVLGIIFGASSLYLVLKVGMTVSASIPVAVLSITLFRLFSRMFGFRRATILENNIVQTTGSAGESIAFGVGIAMPAVMYVGFDMDLWTVMAVSVLGGALGILMMIPLRRAFIVKQHGTLRYPEGTACADVLIVGEQGGASAKTVFTGFGIAFVYEILRMGTKLWKETVAYPLAWFQKATPAIEVNPVLLGVGYIIGTRISCIMVAGGVLASFLLIPAIRFFGSGLAAPLYPASELISRMSESDIQEKYVMYIGAGAVATGGIISLVRSLPLIFSSFAAAMRDLRQTDRSGPARAPCTHGRRTDHDLSLRVVGVGSLLLVLLIWATLSFGVFGPLSMGAARHQPDRRGADRALRVPLRDGFLAVDGRNRLIVESDLRDDGGDAAFDLPDIPDAALGDAGAPVDRTFDRGHRLHRLLQRRHDFAGPENRIPGRRHAQVPAVRDPRGLDLLRPGDRPSADRAEPLEHGLHGQEPAETRARGGRARACRHGIRPRRPHALPRLACAGGERGRAPPGRYLVDDQGQVKYRVDPGITGELNHRDDGTEVKKLCAPQTLLFAFITKGILTQKLPWTLVLLGVAIAVVLELSGVPSLPFAVGVYLPLSSSAPIFVGGLMRHIAERAARTPGGRPPSEAENEMGPGVLLSTGYVAGGAIGAVLVNFLAISDDIPRQLSVWQYRQTAIAEAKPLQEQYEDAAAIDLGIKTPEAREQYKQQIQDMADEISRINEARLPPYVRVPRGMELLLPKKEPYHAGADTTLGAVAEGSAKRAALLQTLNADKLKPPEQLPVGAEIALPQRNWPALVLFSVLAGLLLAVGAGWWLRGE